MGAGLGAAGLGESLRARMMSRMMRTAPITAAMACLGFMAASFLDEGGKRLFRMKSPEGRHCEEFRSGLLRAGTTKQSRCYPLRFETGSMNACYYIYSKSVPVIPGWDKKIEVVTSYRGAG